MRELETVDAVRVESVGKREKPTIIYDEDNFSRAHEYSKAIRSAANKMVRRGLRRRSGRR